MVIDSSALLAILLDEDEMHPFSAAIADADSRTMSAATYVEASMLLYARRGQAGLGGMDGLLRRYEIEIVEVTAQQAKLARKAFIEFGRGKHPAKLNFGDCFAYALAKALHEPLLFKGNDFSQTDIAPA